MLTYPKSTTRVRRMPMHLSSGYVTLMPEKFNPPPFNFPESDLRRRADSRWAVPQISSFIFLSTRDLREAWADRREILHDGQYYALFYNAGPKFWGTHPKKISGAKNMQNVAQFRTTSKFGGEYLWNGWRYSKSDSHSVYSDSYCVRRNKSGEVWSSDLGDLDVKSYPPKTHFSENHISASKGCCAPKFLHVLENHQVLLAHVHRGRGFPLQLFSKGGQKLP